MANYSQAQVFPILSYANTFADMMVATNGLVQQNNDLAANNFVKPTGTLFLNDASLGLQVNTAAIVAGTFQVQGTGSSGYIQNTLRVDGQVNFTNTSTSLLANGAIQSYGSGTGLYVANNATVSGVLTVSGNETVGGSLGVTGSTSLSNTVTISGSTSISNTLLVSGTTTVSNTINGQYLNITNSVITNSLISNTSIQAGSITTTGVGSFNSVQSGGLTASSIGVTGTTITNALQSNTSVSAATLSVTGTEYVNFTQANTGVNTSTLSVTSTGYLNVVQANTSVNTATLSVTGTAYVNTLQANSSINTSTISVTGTEYVNFTQANSGVNTATLSVTGTTYSNIVNANTSIATPTLNVSSTLLGNTATGFFNNLSILNQLSIGGNFVINGSTVYNSNTFTLNSASATGQNSSFTVNRGSSGANAAIRWNESTQYFDILDVNNITSYSQIMTANMISSSLTSTSTSTTASSAAANTLYSYLVANVTSLNSIATSAFNRANASYAQANTTANTFVGTIGSATPLNSALTLSSNNGIVVSGQTNTLYFNSPQDIRTSASPTFNALTLNSPLPVSSGGTGATSAGTALTNLLPSGTTAGYVLTTGGAGNFYWAQGTGGGGGGTTPGTTINSTYTSYTGNGTGIAYTTPTYVPGTDQLKVYVDGVRQFPGTYSETSNTVVAFNTSPPNSSKILLEVDGYILNPYYANNIAYTINANISGTANTIQLAIDGLVSQVVTNYTQVAYGNAAFAQANTASNTATLAASFANGAFVTANSAASFANGAFGQANSAASFANGAFTLANTTSTNTAFAANTQLPITFANTVTLNYPVTASNTVNVGLNSINTTHFTVQESAGGHLLIKYGSTILLSIDSSGNMVVKGNVSMGGTPS